jgi:U3 small nucleolar RNA-associated protein MPP10
MEREEIKKVEKELVKSKEWKYLGEIDSKSRPINSLLDQEGIQFEQNNPILQLSRAEDNEIEKMVIRRVREKKFDNFVFKGEDERVFETECSEDNEYSKNDLSKTEIYELYSLIDNELNRISDFGGSHLFTDGCIKKKEDSRDKSVDNNVFDEEKKKKVTKKNSEAINVLKKNKNVKIV